LDETTRKEIIRKAIERNKQKPKEETQEEETQKEETTKVKLEQLKLDTENITNDLMKLPRPKMKDLPELENRLTQIETKLENTEPAPEEENLKELFNQMKNDIQIVRLKLDTENITNELTTFPKIKMKEIHQLDKRVADFRNEQSKVNDLLTNADEITSDNKAHDTPEIIEAIKNLDDKQKDIKAKTEENKNNALGTLYDDLNNAINRRRAILNNILDGRKNEEAEKLIQQEKELADKQTELENQQKEFEKKHAEQEKNLANKTIPMESKNISSDQKKSATLPTS